MTDFRLPPFDAGIKAQLDAQREQLKALGGEQHEARKQAEQALTSLARPGVPPSAQRMVEEQTREAIAAWRRDITNREKDLANRQQGLRELEALAEREYGIPTPRPAPVNPPTAEPAAAPSATVNDNHDRGVADSIAPLTSSPRRKPGPQHEQDWPMLVARDLISLALASKPVPSAAKMIERCGAACDYYPELRPMQKLIKLLLTPLPKRTN